MKLHRRTRSRLAATAAAAAVIGLTFYQGPAATAAGSTVAPGAAAGLAFRQPATALGGSYGSSNDEIVAGIGDDEGFHIMVARESDGFAWSNLVTLDIPAVDTGLWTGYTCTTGDGRYAVAVYAPSAATNTPALDEAGAFASVVDLATGKATPVAAGVQLAYHSPGCGTGDQAVLTRAIGIDEQKTQLLDVDTARGVVTSIKTVASQATNAVPTAAGDVAVVDGSLSRINADGTVARLAKLPGEAYGVVATSQGVDVVSGSDGRGTVSHWSGSALTTLGSGTLGKIRLYQQYGGTDLVVGDVAGIKVGATGMRMLSRPTLPDAVSLHGDLLADDVESEEADTLAKDTIGSTAPQAESGKIYIAATATHTGTTVNGVLTANGPLSTDVAPDQVTKADVPTEQASAASAGMVTVNTDTGKTTSVPESTLGGTALLVAPADYVSGSSNPAASGDYEVAVDLSTAYDETTVDDPTCLIPRNSTADQVLQPDHEMVEWAVDQAVHGDLTLTRPADYLKTDQAAYSPDTMFPLVSLSGGGTVPAQVELGILAQESNFDQASWHAVAGESGNPLISDYYGTALPTGTADNPDVVPSYGTTDCGYGIGQVTDGMSDLDSDPYSTADATAVATDYAANIAASVQILSQTWNELAAMGMTVNDGSANYIENWFLAIWGYNSGVYPEADESSNGNYGVGWYNNPANPNFPVDRSPFLDNLTTSNDAAHPADWPYEERVMGWIVHPQDSEYATPTFGTSVSDTYTSNDDATYSTVNIPENTEPKDTGLWSFCSSSNACTASVSNPCPDDSSACWWHNPVSWIPVENAEYAATENLSYSLGSGEPAIVAQYAADCPDEADFRELLNPGTVIVTDLADPNDNTRGCTWSGNEGKFAIRLGDNISIGDNPAGEMQDNPASAQIDLHQIGGGFLGHFYFTHTYDGTDVTSATTCIPNGTSSCAFEETEQVPAQIQHKVLGQWTPQLPDAADDDFYAVLAAIPAVAGAAPGVTYKIDPGTNPTTDIEEASTECTVDQTDTGSDYWLEIGVFQLGPNADVQLSNMVDGATGSTDIAFSAMAFEPVSATEDSCTDQVVGGLE